MSRVLSGDDTTDGLDLIITKLEKQTRNKQKKQLYRDLLNRIDKYYNERYGMICYRYYRYLKLNLDNIDDLEEE